MEHHHRTSDDVTRKQPAYDGTTIKMGALTEVQVQLARAGDEGVRAVVAQLLAAKKI